MRIQMFPYILGDRKQTCWLCSEPEYRSKCYPIQGHWYCRECAILKRNDIYAHRRIKLPTGG